MKYKKLRKKIKNETSTCKWLKWFKWKRTCKDKNEIPQD